MPTEDVIRAIAVDVAVIRERINELPSLMKRITDLEKTDAKRTAWAAGAGAVVSVFLWACARLHLFTLTLAFVLYGCAPPKHYYGPPDKLSTLAWHRPVVMLVSSALSQQCRAEYFWAMAFWQEQGATYLTGMVADVDEPVFNFITATPGRPDNEAWAGRTSYLTFKDLMLYADIRIKPGWCVPAVVKHELGHALGLDDSYEEGSVMFYAVPGQGLRVTDAQRKQIK